MVTAARNRKKMLGCISGHESTISTSARTLSPTASPYQGRPGTAERRRRVSVCGAPSVSLDVCCVDSKRDRKGVIIVSPHQGAKDGPTQPYPTPRRHGRGPHRPVLPHRRRLRPPQPRREALRASQAACRLGGHRARALPAAEGGGERALLPAGHRAVLLPPVPRGGGLYPSSFHRRVRKLRRFLEPLRREIVPELVGEAETLLVDSTLLEVLHPRQVSRSAGFDGAGWVRWGSFSVYGVKLHLLCAPNRVPISYELTPANVAD